MPVYRVSRMSTSNVEEHFNHSLIRLAASFPKEDPDRAVILATVQEDKFNLYDRYLKFRQELLSAEEYSHPGLNIRMDQYKAVSTTPKSFEVLENLWFNESRTPAKVHAWASRIRDPNVAVSLAYTAWKLRQGWLRRYENEYFFENWDDQMSQFKAFAQIVEAACEARFWEIAGKESRTKPVKDVIPKFSPPPIPENLIPTTAGAWNLYEKRGSTEAALNLAKAMETILKSAGKNILPTNTDEKNAQYVNELRNQMDKIFDHYSEWGASDGEPESVFRSVLRTYLSLYLDKWTFPKTQRALSY